MEQHGLVGRTTSAGAVFIGTEVDRDGVPSTLSVEQDPSSKVALGILVLLFGGVGLFCAAVVVSALVHREGDWGTFATVLGIGTLIVFGLAGWCFLLTCQRRLFVRGADGFLTFVQPMGGRAREYAWSDVEWLGVYESYSGGTSYAALQMKLHDSPHPISLIERGDRHALMELLMSWSSDQWRRAPKQRHIHDKFVRVA